MKSKLVLLVGLALAGANAMACYTVYDSRDRVLYNGVDTPVDLSMQLHDALRARGYPAGSRMEFAQAQDCRPVTAGALARPTGSDVPPNTMRLERSARRAARKEAPAPLFTDRETAETSRLPHMQVAGDIVMVPPQAANRAIQPTVTVLPASTWVASSAPSGAPDTRSLGAGPAHPAATPMSGRRQVVITELRDPPVTVVNNGGNVTVMPGR